MSDLHPALAAFAAQRSSAFTALVGIEFTAIERGQCTLRLAIEDKHFNSTGRAHGGWFLPCWTRPWALPLSACWSRMK